ncbi:MAG: siderophore-interacting protein [Microbacterium sp.]|uniref:siderophore-interacting protein n=1 Tax=Microbacterium sp. TaxID=51671 RepID=UPI0039E29554
MAHEYTSHPLVVRRATVRRVEDVTPRMRRVVVGVLRDPASGEPEFRAPGFDDHVKLILAADGDIAAALPRQVPGGIEWTPAENRITRDYTPRRVDPRTGEMDLDFVLHGDGPAVSWARSALEGDELFFVGPKSSVRLPPGLDWMLLIADETGLPAVGRFLDERPIEAPVHVLCMIEHESARQPLATREGDTLTWRVARGGDATALEAAVRQLPLPAGHGYVWAVAESRALLPVRRYVQRELGLPKDRLDITGYWHLAENDETDEPAATPIAGPVAWFVVRAALQLGLIDALAAGPRPLAALAEAAGAEPRAVAALLPVLAVHGVVVGEESALSLGPVGDELLDGHEREEYLGAEAELTLSLAGLATSMRASTPTWQAATGDTLAWAAASDPDVYGMLLEEAAGLGYVLHPLLADELVVAAAALVVAGPGVPALLAGLEQAGRDGRRVSVLPGADPVDQLRAALADPSRILVSETPADLAVLALALNHRTDAESVALLRRVAGMAPAAVVVERARADGLSPRAAERQVTAYAMTGAPLRDPAAVSALAAEAGWRHARTIELGWGIVATVLRRA